jgi:hypothetical protein
MNVADLGTSKQKNIQLSLVGWASCPPYLVAARVACPTRFEDVVGELTRDLTPSMANDDVGAKHSGDQFCRLTEISLSEC